jgi:hypothetical protein
MKMSKISNENQYRNENNGENNQRKQCQLKRRERRRKWRQLKANGQLAASVMWRRIECSRKKIINNGINRMARWQTRQKASARSALAAARRCVAYLHLS